MVVEANPYDDHQVYYPAKIMSHIEVGFQKYYNIIVSDNNVDFSLSYDFRWTNYEVIPRPVHNTETCVLYIIYIIKL